MERSGSKNETSKVGRTDRKNWEDLTLKMRRTDFEKIRRSESEDEKDSLRKVGWTDPKKWTGLTLKMIRTDFEKWGRLTHKNEKV